MRKFDSGSASFPDRHEKKHPPTVLPRKEEYKVKKKKIAILDQLTPPKRKSRVNKR